MTSLNSQISSVNTALNNLDTSQNVSLLQQDRIAKILNNETQRLDSKKRQVDMASENQKRIVYFNDNNRKINAAYLKIIIIFTITLAIIWLITIINTTFSPPEYIIQILIVVVVSTWLILSYSYYSAIQVRDRYNFDEYKHSPPNTTPTDSSTSATISGSGDFGGFGSCIGSSCCYPPTETESGTIWDSDKSQCVFAPATAKKEGLTNPTINPAPTTTTPARTIMTVSPAPTISLATTSTPIFTTLASTTTPAPTSNTFAILENSPISF